MDKHYLDFNKAFDKMSHTILVEVEKCVLCDNRIRQIQIWLKDCAQKIVVNCAVSRVLEVSGGLPTGIYAYFCSI